MAITNAQQYKQLLAKGGRIGLKGGADASEFGKSGSNVNVSSSGSVSKSKSVSPGAGNSRRGDEKPVERPSEINPLNEIKRELTLENFRNRRPEVNIPPYMIGAKMFQPFIQKFSDISAKENRGFFANPNYRFNLFGIDLGPKKSVIEAGRYQLPGELGVKYGKLGYEDIGQMTEEELDQAYKEYLNAKLSGEIDAYGNPLIRGDGDQPIIPLTTYQENVVKDEVDPNSLAGLLANRQAYRFMADGGRAGYQQGGGIMPRLNQLGSSVSSAEQILQEINQRLESAESSLGESSGEPQGQLVGGNSTNIINNNRPPGIIDNNRPPGGYPKVPALTDIYAEAARPLFDKDGFRLGDQRYGTGLVGGPQMAILPGSSMSGGPMQSPLATAIGLASGGRVGLMGGGMPYEGGIMDLESARQMYGLGKLVKKATGAIKKIVKSPVGKAALLAGGAGLFGYGPAKELFASGKGLGFKDFLTRAFLGKEVSGGDPAGRGRTGGILQFMKDNPLLTIAGGSTLAGLLASQDEEDEVQPYYRGPSLDINAIRNNPYGTKGPAFGFYAEGGNVKEPVAKDTMPLLDMNGMEKDYRADGGFVPIGRMERADDVPARLSKNEFVFTADAVRNAGDGDIDKGAEVMYNVMKNLEAGGDISEESQGLNGARDMFQTSKRLEEVL